MTQDEQRAMHNIIRTQTGCSYDIAERTVGLLLPIIGPSERRAFLRGQEDMESRMRNRPGDGDMGG